MKISNKEVLLSELLKKNGYHTFGLLVGSYNHARYGKHIKSIQKKEWHFIHSASEDKSLLTNELFNLNHDPGEINNLANKSPGKVQSFLKELQAWELENQSLYKKTTIQANHE